MRSLQVALARVVVFALGAVFVGLAGGCPSSVDEDPAEGEHTGDEGEGEGGEGEGEGEGEAGEGEGEGEGEGDPVDGGNGFDLGSLLDGGVLECLPEQLPTLDIAGAIDALGFGFYSGSPEDGVVCGLDPARVTCDEGFPCCNLCGFAACAGEDPFGPPDAGPSCPIFSNVYACDGEEDCNGNDVCCFTLSGSECREEADCAFDVGGTLSQFFSDGGISLPDAGFTDGGFVDGGFTNGSPIDGGFVDVAEDAGFIEPDGGPLAVDAGFVQVPADGGFTQVGVDGGPGPQLDAGSLLDGLQTALDQGVPVCRSSLFDCDILSAEACCTSDRLPALDIGFCLPALLCAGSLLP